MLKKIKAVSSLVALSAPTFACEAIRFELTQSDISFIVDETTRTAIVRHIYLRIDEDGKDIAIPAKIEFKYFGAYTVVGVLPGAVKDISTKIKSVVLPKTLTSTAENKEMFTFLVNENIHISWSEAPKEEKPVLLFDSTMAQNQTVNINQ